MQNTYLNGVDIKVETFDLSLLGGEYKLDLLYYNDINRYGEVLTSLVFNSGIKNANDTSLIVYNPNKLFLNNTFEKSYTYTDKTITRWRNNDIPALLSTSNLRDNSFEAIYNYSKFNINTNVSTSYLNGEHSYDGWYTLCSVILKGYTDFNDVIIGTLRYNVNTSKAQYNIAPYVWKDLNIVDTSIPIYNILQGNRGDIYQTYDFVSTVKINSLNKQLMDNKFDKNWFKKVNILTPKLRTLDNAIEFKKYDVSQHIINSINSSLLSLLI